MTTKAPETIWATPEDGYCTATDLPGDKRHALGFERYIHEDLHAAVVAERDALRAALVEANDLLRSTMQIATRAIQHEEFRVLANWDAFHDRVAVHLKRRHQITNEARAALAKQEPKA